MNQWINDLTEWFKNSITAIKNWSSFKSVPGTCWPVVTKYKAVLVILCTSKSNRNQMTAQCSSKQF